MKEFGRLLEKEIPRLRRYAFALTRDMSRADDLVQDTLVRSNCKATLLAVGYRPSRLALHHYASSECGHHLTQRARRQRRRGRRYVASEFRSACAR
jgi:DNA-directed RNA polymerase specialized sigma24 family protein